MRSGPPIDWPTSSIKSIRRLLSQQAAIVARNSRPCMGPGTAWRRQRTVNLRTVALPDEIDPSISVPAGGAMSGRAIRSLASDPRLTTVLPVRFRVLPLPNDSRAQSNGSRPPTGLVGTRRVGAESAGPGESTGITIFCPMSPPPAPL